MQSPPGFHHDIKPMDIRTLNHGAMQAATWSLTASHVAAAWGRRIGRQESKQRAGPDRLAALSRGSIANHPEAGKQGSWQSIRPSSIYSIRARAWVAGGESEAPSAPMIDRTLMVKLSLASSTGRLDLTDCRLKVRGLGYDERSNELLHATVWGGVAVSIQSLGLLNPYIMSWQPMNASYVPLSLYCQVLPEEVFDIEGLQELSLAGNCLSEIPPAIGRLTSLRKLQLAGARPHNACVEANRMLQRVLQ